MSRARVIITLDVETNLDDDSIERRLEALIDPEEIAALMLEEGDHLTLINTTIDVERQPVPRCDCETCKRHDERAATLREKLRQMPEALAREPHLPEHLHAAYEWTDAAGELDELKRLTGDELVTYCRESADNAREHDTLDVTEGALELLHQWLNP